MWIFLLNKVNTKVGHHYFAPNCRWIKQIKLKKKLLRAFQCKLILFLSKAGLTLESEVPKRAAGCGGETLSEVCFLPDLWEGPRISNAFNWAGWRVCDQKRDWRSWSTSVSVWENCRPKGVQFICRVMFTWSFETLTVCFAPNLLPFRPINRAPETEIDWLETRIL